MGDADKDVGVPTAPEFAIFRLRVSFEWKADDKRYVCFWRTATLSLFIREKDTLPSRKTDFGFCSNSLNKCSENKIFKFILDIGYESNYFNLKRTSQSICEALSL